MVSKMDHSCVPNLVVMEIEAKLYNCRKRAREDVSVSVHAIYKKEQLDIYTKETW
jgi:hypothetical protein